MRDYVSYWYHDISKDEEFPRTLRELTHRTLATLSSWLVAIFQEYYAPFLILLIYTCMIIVFFISSCESLNLFSAHFPALLRCRCKEDTMNWVYMDTQRSLSCHLFSSPTANFTLLTLIFNSSLPDTSTDTHARTRTFQLYSLSLLLFTLTRSYAYACPRMCSHLFFPVKYFL